MLPTAIFKSTNKKHDTESRIKFYALSQQIKQSGIREYESESGVCIVSSLNEIRERASQTEYVVFVYPNIKGNPTSLRPTAREVSESVYDGSANVTCFSENELTSLMSRTINEIDKDRIRL